MGWGILEDKSGLANVPGTTLLDDESNTNASVRFEHLKKVSHRGETIILVPQPSNDPNDPLNWPLWGRDLLLLLFTYCTFLVIGGIGPILSSLALDLSILFDVSYTKVSLLTGFSLCATGASGIFISAVTDKFGKRIPLLFSMTCAFVGTMWGGFAESYDSLLGARIVQGFSLAMFESVIFSVVGDLYFVHERGTRAAIIATMVTGVSNLPAVLAGKIATTLGWRWVFWLLAIFLGIGVVLAVLFGWETVYDRNAIYNTDLASQDNLDTLDAKRVVGSDTSRVEKLDSNPMDLSRAETAASAAYPRKSFLARMKPYSGSYTKKPLWELVIAPVLIFSHPITIWAVILMSFPTLWLVCINLLIAQIFAAPPYLLKTAALGYLSAGPVVGGFISAVACAAMSDPIIKYMSRRNNGVYEPEFRLVLIIPAIICSAIGYFCFGALIQEGKSPAGMSALWGVAAMSIQFIYTMVGSYCVDAYRDLSVEIFIATMIVKNFLFYGFSYFLNDWAAKWGPRKMFYTIAGIQLALCLTTVPLYIFGKRLRAWWHKKGVVHV